MTSLGITSQGCWENQDSVLGPLQGFRIPPDLGEGSHLTSDKRCPFLDLPLPLGKVRRWGSFPCDPGRPGDAEWIATSLSPPGQTAIFITAQVLTDLCHWLHQNSESRYFPQSGKVETQRGGVACPRSHSLELTELGLKPGLDSSSSASFLVSHDPPRGQVS